MKALALLLGRPYSPSWVRSILLPDRQSEGSYIYAAAGAATPCSEKANGTIKFFKYDIKFF
jgi:hypothetical protein